MDKLPNELVPSRLLLVDDDPDILMIMKLQLRHAGYMISVAEHAPQALELLQSETFDLMITDAMMPGMSGYDLVKALRQLPATTNLPVIMVTALSYQQDKTKAFEDGVDEFITKPYDVTELKAKISQLLCRRHNNLTSNC